MVAVGRVAVGVIVGPPGVYVRVDVGRTAERPLWRMKGRKTPFGGGVPGVRGTAVGVRSMPVGVRLAVGVGVRLVAVRVGDGPGVVGTVGTGTVSVVVGAAPFGR